MIANEPKAPPKSHLQKEPRNANGKIRTLPLSPTSTTESKTQSSTFQEKQTSQERPHQRHAIDVIQSSLASIDAYYTEDYINRKKKMNAKLEKKKSSQPPQLSPPPEES